MVEQTSSTEVKLIPVNLAEAKLTGKVCKLDANEDAWEYAAPPDPGVYKFRLFTPKEGFKQGKVNPNDVEDIYYQCGVEAKIVSDNPDVDGFSVPCYFTTRLGRRKQISTMAGMIVKMGFQIPSEATDLRIAKMFEAALKREPIVEGELDWRGAYQESEGKKEWINVWRTASEFPEILGVRQHIAFTTDKQGNKHEIRAQANIKKWYGKGEARQGSAGLVSAPRQQVRVQVPVPELLEHTVGVSSIVAPAKSVGSTSMDQDLQELLSEL